MHPQRFGLCGLFALLAVVSVVVVPQAARAEDAHVATQQQAHEALLGVSGATKPPPAPPSLFDGEWYGWQTLASDGISLLVALTPAISLHAFGERWSDPAVDLSIALGVAGLALGPLVLHVSHGNIGRGIASPLFRLISVWLAVVHLMTQPEADQCWPDPCSPSFVVPVALVLAGPAFDALFAWDTTDAKPDVQVLVTRHDDGAVVHVATAF